MYSYKAIKNSPKDISIFICKKKSFDGIDSDFFFKLANEISREVFSSVNLSKIFLIKQVKDLDF